MPASRPLRKWALVAGLVLSAAGMSPAAARSFPEVMREAIAAKEAGDLERTLALLREAHAIDPQPAVLNNIAKTLEDLGRYAEAADAYRTVVDDESAGDRLRALDRTRLDTVLSKARQCWLLVSNERDAAKVLVDGSPPSVGESPMGEQAHFFEMRAPSRPEVALMIRKLPVGRRVGIGQVLATSLATQGRLHIGSMAPAPKSLRIDGYRLRAPVGEVHVVFVEPGKRYVEVELAEGAWLRAELELTAGREIDLLELIDAQPSLGPSAWSVLSTSAGLPSAAVCRALGNVVGFDSDISAARPSIDPVVSELHGRVLGVKLCSENLP